MLETLCIRKMKNVNKIWCFHDQKWLFNHKLKKQQLILRWHITTCIFKWESLFWTSQFEIWSFEIVAQATEYSCSHSANIHICTVNLSTRWGYSGNIRSLHPSNRERPSATGTQIWENAMEGSVRDSPWLRITRLDFVRLTNWFADSSRDTQLTWQPPWASPWTSSFVCVFLIWCMCLVCSRHSMLNKLVKI